MMRSPHLFTAICLHLSLVGWSSLPNAGAEETALIYLNSERGREMLLEASAAQDYWELSLHFVTQENLAYCGVASGVMVLNALDVPSPATPRYAPYRLFTQENFFNPRAAKVLSAEEVAKRGMTLDELGALLAVHATQVNVYDTDETRLEAFRDLAVRNLKNNKDYILVNYLRKAIGQQTGGHISPLAAYHEATDSLLIYDVSRYKYPPAWVPLKKLWQSMDLIDSDSKRPRGFVTIRKIE